MMQIKFKSAENHDVEKLLTLIHKLYIVDDSISFNAVVARKALIQLLISSSANCLRYYASLLVIGFSPLPITYYQLPAYATV
jgi:hypothetical protein